MRLTFISDTHGLHEKVTLPGGDILLHSGDISLKGKMSDTISFFNWFSKQDYKYKCFIVGNHDIFFDSAYRNIIQLDIPENIHYLENSGVYFEGIYVWGSPVTPRFNNYAFNVDRGDAIAEYWNRIPEHTNILLTHGPAQGILDTNYQNELTGCEELTKFFKESNHSIKIHSCGHIHEARGAEKKIYANTSTFHLNASITSGRLTSIYTPMTVEYDKLELPKWH